MITKKEAKQLSIELWTWLKDNPGCCKHDYPFIKDIEDKLRQTNMALCPLCDIFILSFDESCVGCPLYGSSGQYKPEQGCYKNSDWWIWDDHISDESDILHAGNILNDIQNWEV